MMGRALALARNNHGRTGDNPSVGCVIVDADGHVVGQGATAPGGRPHAEEVALAQAGARASGATAYVTLEPCRQRSSGAPPCWERLYGSGVREVVCAIHDAHPLGSGGLNLLASGGLRVRVGTGGRRALALYREFFSSVPASEATRRR